MASVMHQECCCICQKAVKLLSTADGNSSAVKEQFRVCSLLCSQTLQYVRGVAHGCILMHVLDKLCRNIQSSRGDKLFNMTVMCVKDGEKGSAETTIGPEKLPDTAIKMEQQNPVHPKYEVPGLNLIFGHDDSDNDDSDTCLPRMHVGPSRLTEPGVTVKSQQTVQVVFSSNKCGLEVDGHTDVSENRGGKSLSFGSSLLQCKACLCMFPSNNLQALAEHLCQVHTKDIDLISDICGTVFQERQPLRQQRKKIHRYITGKKTEVECPIFKCVECTKVFSALDDLQEHQTMSHSVDRQGCLCCDRHGETVENMAPLKQHGTVNKSAVEREQAGEIRYLCSQCNKEYPTKTRLQKHNYFVHSKQSTANCDICGKTFKNSFLLRNHIKFLHSKQTPGECEVCGKIFRNTHLMKMHRKVVHKIKVIGELSGKTILQCVLCPQTFPAGVKDPVINHQAVCHSKDFQVNECDVCGVKFKRKGNLAKHVIKCHSQGPAVSSKAECKSRKERGVTDKKSYTCDKCGKAYSQSGLSKHIRIYHSAEEPVVCDVCGKTLINSFHLKLHKRQHVPTRMCHICGAKFKTNAGLRGHLAAHKGIKSHVCEVCGMSFVRKTSWKRHVKLHSEASAFHCDCCLKTFKTVYALNNHMLAKHQRGVYFTNRLKTLEEVGYSVDKPAVERHLSGQCATCSMPMENGVCTQHPDSCTLRFKCSFCEIAVSHVDELCQHLKKHNIPLAFTASTGNYTASWSAKRDDSDRDYVCQVCQKRFLRRENLLGHMRQHKEKAFACPVCCKMFTYKCNLKNHLHVHSEDKPFQCDVCQKSFKCKQLLRNHQLVHNLSESPYKCQVCGKGLSRKFFLLRHYRHMHPGVAV